MSNIQVIVYFRWLNSQNKFDESVSHHQSTWIGDEVFPIQIVNNLDHHYYYYYYLLFFKIIKIKNQSIEDGERRQTCGQAI